MKRVGGWEGQRRMTPDALLIPGLTSESSGSLFRNASAQAPHPEFPRNELGRGPGMGSFRLLGASDVQVVLRGWRQSRRRWTALRWAAWD